MPNFNIGSYVIGSESTFFVVEEGQANQGDFDAALEMISVAANTGADAIEFQLATAADFYIREHYGYKIYKDREFSDAQLIELCTSAKENKIELIVAPFSLHVIKVMAANGASAFNINGSDLTNPEILDAVADSGLPFFLSLLLADEAEIDWAVKRIKHNSPSAKFGLLLGQHTMASGGDGVALEHTNLGYLKTLKERYNIPVGFIDHTSLDWTASLAVSAGADVITKHLAISRETQGPDWKICLEPPEMERCIANVRAIAPSLISIEKEMAPGEDVDRSKMRRSIVASEDLSHGTVLTREHFVFRRPGTGLSPEKYPELVGRKLKGDFKMDDQITLEDVELEGKK
jgi:N,N'-diacetyllegionaminate synthase